MPDIDQIICQSLNPFSEETLVVPNFWEKQETLKSTIDSIHQNQLIELESMLDLVIEQKYSKTVVLSGDSGLGKSHLLARLKQKLNPKAFFAYIEPWADSNHMWRHILRQTVESLIHVPEGEQDSQLLLWLKGLTSSRKKEFTQWILGERNSFISDLSAAFPSGLYNARSFFGVLYDLTNLDLYPIACQWLKGDDLAEEDLKLLRLRKSINSEDAAKGILINFAMISSRTKPIVLCFDNLDNLPRRPDGNLDFQGLFNLNSTIYTQYIRNLFIIISAITNTWEREKKQVQPADLTSGRVQKVIKLKSINLKQAEALWEMRLRPLHSQANPTPRSSLYPLNHQQLKINFPIHGDEPKPRDVLELGRTLFQQYKNGLLGSSPQPEVENIDSAFQLLWRSEYNKIQAKISRVTLLPAPDLIQMLAEALQAVGMANVKPQLLTGTYSSYSLSYTNNGKVGVVWAENANMNSFCHIMRACEKVEKQCNVLYLIRVSSVGHPNLRGHKIYRQIFSRPANTHIRENLTSVHHLATYHKLVKDAIANELVIAGQTITLKKLQELIRKSKILNQCQLLQELGVFGQAKVPEPETTTKAQTASPSTAKPKDKKPSPKQLEIIELVKPEQELKRYLVNQVNVQNFMGLATLINNAHQEFPDVEVAAIEKAIQQLCEANAVKIMDTNAPKASQLIMSIPGNVQS